MLSERITELFRLLQCSNSDIARFAGCSPSNISRLKSGLREPSAHSRAILRLVQGIYRYADHENLLPLLCELCEADKAGPDDLIPAVVTWLYEEQTYELPTPRQPRSRQEKARRQKSFGERLDQAMTVLDYSNGRLAADLNVDASLVSRYRAGIYHPNRNVQIRDSLVELLLSRAEKLGRLGEVAALCCLSWEMLSPEALAEWLYATGEDPYSEIAESLLRSIDALEPGKGMSAVPPKIPGIQERDRYWGTKGLRDAVVRFLKEASQEGGELLLYSDEPMDWMSRDPEFFALWASLMESCVRRGVHIRIIHNLERSGREMVFAIKGWLPLYISGLIEPYVFSMSRNARFHHTIFLRPAGAAILGFFPARAGEGRWYDYITDREQLDVLGSGYEAMLADASPFLTTCPADRMGESWSGIQDRTGKTVVIPGGLSVATLPEELLGKMLSRAEISPEQRRGALELHRARREQLAEILEKGELHELLCLPDPSQVKEGRVNVNFEAETNGLYVPYTGKDYIDHLEAVKDLLRREKHYHLTLLPETPFQDLQVSTAKDAVAVIRRRKPFTAFIFREATLVQSVSYYGDALAQKYDTGRYGAIQALDTLCRQIS